MGVYSLFAEILESEHQKLKDLYNKIRNDDLDGDFLPIKDDIIQTCELITRWENLDSTSDNDIQIIRNVMATVYRGFDKADSKELKHTLKRVNQLSLDSRELYRVREEYQDLISKFNSRKE